ncbi:MAG: SMP-30/gluconolactonase/LRE family protein [Steroidobacteraceae bacterium]
MARSTSDIKLIEIIPAGDTTGEGVLWDWRRQALWWTDIQRSRLYRFDWATHQRQMLPAPERIGSFGLITGSDRLITAFASGIAIYEPASKEVTWLTRPDVSRPNMRFNDGRVDRRGRFWAGTMQDLAPRSPVGKLYSYDATHGLRCHVTDVLISNGLCMSPDGSQLYFADSPTHTINTYEMDATTGTLAAPHLFARTAAPAVPDGATVDADGCMWSAQWGGSSVVRYTPDGHEDLRVSLPASQVTCVCFGGPGLDLMFITSARENLDAAALQSEPHAGDVFVYQTPFKGLPEEEYRP